ncbi:MAG TPA: MiaB/RimO family radical SAM methylthiotransferase [Humisphaera sp.]|jgi:threonylcarbamoyladenosine tRNA methylthiotransferase MtaB|nr:MiaB/RimO family radical SAM methylthiotransferase [Humisphaera sp.]
MKTFSIQTLGCKVNHYESEQIATLLRSRGLTQTDPPQAELRVVNTCSITTAAASQSRQSVRRVTRLPMFNDQAFNDRPLDDRPAQTVENFTGFNPSTKTNLPNHGRRSRVLVTGCWATSDRDKAQSIPGVDAVLGHHDDVAAELNRLLAAWDTQDQRSAGELAGTQEQLPGPDALDENNNGWMLQAGTSASQLTSDIKTSAALHVNRNFVEIATSCNDLPKSSGTFSLPQLDGRQAHRQRAVLKVQDGCDAHCTYCIIPTLRPNLWSKPTEQVVEEARSLVAAGHHEIVLTGIFLGAYGQTTALRRRQPKEAAKPIGRLVSALCDGVPGLRRLRLSSLEPGDLSAELIDVFRSHPQIVPHFHLPLQSGSDLILRRMNRQYTRGDFLEMVDRLGSAFDRPALTTDIVVGFPGEDDAEFEHTADVVRQAGFIHVHAFPYSPRPGTAAARWTDQFIYGPIIQERIEQLTQMADDNSLRFRQSFIGETVEVIVERDHPRGERADSGGTLRHGRCERYFDVCFDDETAMPGDARAVCVTRVSGACTLGMAK